MGFVDIHGWEPKHLSFSTLNGWRMCGKQTYFGKVLGLEQHPGFAAIGGNAVHEASEAVEKLIVERGYDALTEIPPQVLDTTAGQADGSRYGPDSKPDF